MSKNLPEKLFDVRTRKSYLTKGKISEKDVENYIAALPDDADNFELTSFEDDDFFGTMTDEEISSMAPMTEDAINDFDFLNETKDASQSEPSFLPADEDDF